MGLRLAVPGECAETCVHAEVLRTSAGAGAGAGAEVAVAEVHRRVMDIAQGRVAYAGITREADA